MIFARFRYGSDAAPPAASGGRTPWAVLLCLAILPGGHLLADSGAQCCSSIAPEFPPATNYGATIYRDDDPRNHYQPYQAMPLDASAPPELLLQQLWLQEGQAGVYSPALVPGLTNLGAAYFADGDYEAAIDTYRRAVHILRINEGLNTPSQLGMVEQIIEAHIALGDYVAADGQQEYMFRIRSAHMSPSDPEMVGAVEQLADWHRAAYLGQLDKFRYPRIVDLLDLYGTMAEAVEREKGGVSRDMLPYLEGKLRTEYMLSVYPGEREEGLQIEAGQNRGSDLTDLEKMRFMAFEKDNYRNGLKTIRTIGEILVAEGADPRERAEVQVKLGDWYQWHRRFAQAIKSYEEAWAMMEEQPGGADWLRATFSKPLELPSQVIFQPGRMPLRLYNDAEIRARFMVSRHGQAEDIEILSPDSDENRSAVIRFLSYLRYLRFRPVLENGAVVATSGFERTYSIRF